MSSDLPAPRFGVKLPAYPAWPDGRTSAITLTFDVDCDSMLHYTYPQSATNRIAARSSAHYDVVATPRILELLRSYGLPATFFFPAWCLDSYPDLARRIAESGHEIGLHGYIHERAVELASRAAEAQWLERSVETYQRHFGASPRGWRAPMYGFSAHTAGLLVEHGFAYDSSLAGHDLPYLLTSGDAAIVELPIDWTADDWPQFVQSVDFAYTAPIRSASAGVQVFREEMAATIQVGGFWSTVWHPGVMGRPSRLLQLQTVLDECLATGGVWFATMHEVASHISTAVQAGRVVERIAFEPEPAVPAAVELRAQVARNGAAR